MKALAFFYEGKRRALTFSFCWCAPAPTDQQFSVHKAQRIQVKYFREQSLCWTILQRTAKSVYSPSENDVVWGQPAVVKLPFEVATSGRRCASRNLHCRSRPPLRRRVELRGAVSDAWLCCSTSPPGLRRRALRLLCSPNPLPQGPRRR